MIRFCSYFYRHLRLIYSVNQYIYLYKGNGAHDIVLLDTIIERIKSCGSVAIKFCQWITPKLEIMYLDEENIITNEKPLWLSKLEDFYENCDEHAIQYTFEHYKEVFKKDFNEDYEILDIIGSGSIGQVYLIQDKPLTKYSTRQKYVMKIQHPNVKYEINFFRKFYKIMKLCSSINKLLHESFPFDINNFIDQFNEQSDFVNESNHLLKFKEYYKDNDFIVIPELIKTSPSIMIMSYEEGQTFEKVDADKYQKYKIALLLCSFTRNNQHILNYHHGDLHKGNWKARKFGDQYQLVIYDFGFCWTVPNHKIDGVDDISKIFENSDINLKSVDLNTMTNILSCFLRYELKDEQNVKQMILEYLENNLDEIKPWNINPSRLFKMTVNVCISQKLLIDPMLIQSLILLIQCEKIFSEFRMMSSDTDEIHSYEVFRSKYLDWLTFYKTNDIFHDFSDYISDILNEKQIEVDTIFDCIEMSDEIKNMALRN